MRCSVASIVSKMLYLMNAITFQGSPTSGSEQCRAVTIWQVGSLRREFLWRAICMSIMAGWEGGPPWNMVRLKGEVCQAETWIEALMGC